MSSVPEKSRDASGQRPTSCPNCGFDMEPGRPCQICGYSPLASVSAAQRKAPTPAGGTGAAAPARRTRGGGTLLALLLSAAGLLLILTIFLLASEMRRPAEAAQGISQDNTTAGQAAQTPPDQGKAEPGGSEPAQVPQAAAPQAPAAAEPSPAPAAAVATSAGAELLSVDEPPYDITKRKELPPFYNRQAFVEWMVKHTGEKARFLEQKWERAAIIQRLGNFTHERVREAFLLTPREYFCRDPRRAYENAVLPIGYGQTISGPHLVSRMTDYLDPQPEQKVLEIGTGSGYQSALLSEISNHVYTIEIVDKLARETNAIYKRLEARYPEYRNIKRKVDDGYYGWEEYAPFDRIIVTCGIDHVPPALIRQLKPGGIMVIPVGPPSGQTILRIIKTVAPDGTVGLEREDIYHGKHKQIFVPFTARGGGVHSTEDQKD